MRLPPLDSETGWTGELWSKTNLINWQNQGNSIFFSSTIFDHFWQFLKFFGFLLIFEFFLDFLDFFLDFLGFLRFFEIFSDFRIFDHFWQLLDFLGFLWTFGFFLDFLDFFLDFLDFFWFFLFFWTFFGFWDFLKFFEIFWICFDFVVFFVIVTNVTTKSYQGYYWTPKIAKNGPKQYYKLFFFLKGKKSLGRSPPQELEVVPRSGPYLLVNRPGVAGAVL